MKLTPQLKHWTRLGHSVIAIVGIALLIVASRFTTPDSADRGPSSTKKLTYFRLELSSADR